MKKLILYGTTGCHLCEQAAELLAYLLDEEEYEVEEIDIADFDQLFTLYAEKIPVLKQKDSIAELCWPFGEEQVQHFLS